MEIQRNWLFSHQGIIAILALALVLLSGCTSTTPHSITSLPTSSPPDSSAPDATVMLANESNNNSPVLSRLDISESVLVTIHTWSMYTLRNRAGNDFSVVVFNLSIKNEGLGESFYLDNRSIVSFQSDHEGLNPQYPQEYKVPVTDPLLNRSIAPGEEIRGEVSFYLNKNVRSMPLYVRYPNWTIVGGAYLPDISDVPQSISDREYPKNLEMIVPSAVQKATLPGFNLRPGNQIAIINVSITNHNPTDVTIQRENLLLLTERSVTLEHGGDRLNPEMARDYLRFPIHLHPGETRSGPVIFIIYSRTSTNKLALTDSHYVVNSLVDLNGIYRFE